MPWPGAWRNRLACIRYSSRPATPARTTAALQNVPLTKAEELADFVQREGVSLTVVGPEAPLAAGVVDVFRARGLKIFGPTKAAAQLESSKDYAKAFMVRHSIPTARYQTLRILPWRTPTSTRKARPSSSRPTAWPPARASSCRPRWKRRTAPSTPCWATGRWVRPAPGSSSRNAWRARKPASSSWCDGRHVLALATSQDHKRLKDGDRGPNTGGMGAYSPAPVVTPELHHRIMREVILPTVQGMARDGLPYTGFLYAGLMIASGDDPDRAIKVLEFNCRMGDPETQPIMMRIKSDFVDVVEHAIAGTLEPGGYRLGPPHRPGRSAGGSQLSRYAPYRRCDSRACRKTPRIAWHSTPPPQLDGDQVKTAGGRVLCVTALGDSVRMARERVYETVDRVVFDGRQYRTDIGWRALKRYRTKPKTSTK